MPLTGMDPTLPIPRLNGTGRTAASDFYDTALIDLVGQRYAEDIRLFGYESPSW